MQRLQTLLHVMMVLHLAAAFSSDQERLSGKPLSAIASNIRGAFQSKLKISSNDFSGSFSKPKSRPTVGLLDTTVTGYYIEASYAGSDNLQCRVLESGRAYRLNSCLVYEMDYVIITATATKVLITTYRDAECRTVESVGSPFEMITNCGVLKSYVSESTQIPSSMQTVQFKYFAGVDKSCSSVPEYGEAVQVDTCNDSKKYAVSGNAVVISTYGNSLCTGGVVDSGFGNFGECYGNITATLVSPTTTSSPTTVAKSCFAGSETVSLESGETKRISEVKVGDRVLAADSSRRTLFSEVVFIPHEANTEKATFTQITTSHGRDIRMTGSHILPAGNCRSPSPLHDVYASSVVVGDCIMTVSGIEKVTAVAIVQGQGLYTIVTKDEYVVINGVIASPFAYNHMVANFYYNAHRFIYAWAPGLLKSPLLHSANEAIGILIPLAHLTA